MGDEKTEMEELRAEIASLKEERGRWREAFGLADLDGLDRFVTPEMLREYVTLLERLIKDFSKRAEREVDDCFVAYTSFIRECVDQERTNEAVSSSMNSLIDCTKVFFDKLKEQLAGGMIGSPLHECDTCSFKDDCDKMNEKGEKDSREKLAEIALGSMDGLPKVDA